MNYENLDLLETARNLKGWSYNQTAHEAQKKFARSFNTKTVQNVLCNHKGRPQTVKMLAELLDVPLEWLLPKKQLLMARELKVMAETEA
jgi:transcriptional regulator with XRE-family HTH domain